MLKYDVFGGRLTTCRGDKIAVAGICAKDQTADCQARLSFFEGLSIDTADPTEIDMRIAAALSQQYEGRALAVGATIYMERISSQVYRTGGVLGRPESESEDADHSLEQLDDDVWMYTISGGPGWIGFFQRDKAERLARDTFNHSVQYPAKVNLVYRSLMRLSPWGYLLISDGTGYDSFGLCAAKAGEKELCFVV